MAQWANTFGARSKANIHYLRGSLVWGRWLVWLARLQEGREDEETTAMGWRHPRLLFVICSKSDRMAAPGSWPIKGNDEEEAKYTHGRGKTKIGRLALLQRKRAAAAIVRLSQSLARNLQSLKGFNDSTVDATTSSTARSTNKAAFIGLRGKKC